MTRTYFPCVLLLALAFALAGCDSNEEVDVDGSSTVTVAGSEDDSFEGNAVFVVDENASGGEPFLLVVLFEGRAQDLDDEDDFVAFIWDGRSALSEGDYSTNVFGGEQNEVTTFYQRDDDLFFGMNGEVSVSAASSSRISGTFAFDAVEPFEEEVDVPVSGSFRAVRADTTDLPGLYDGADLGGDASSRTAVGNRLRAARR